jgi:hypothetical protein
MQAGHLSIVLSVAGRRLTVRTSVKAAKLFTLEKCACYVPAAKSLLHLVLFLGRPRGTWQSFTSPLILSLVLIKLCGFGRLAVAS